MKALYTAFFVLVTLFALVPVSTAQEGVRAQTDFVEDEVLVKFIPGTAASEIAAAHQAAGGVVVRRVVALDVQVVKVAAGQAVQRLPLYQRNRNVQYAELNTIVRIADDPLFPTQWGLNNTGQLGGTADADIDAPEAWATGATGSGVKIAVVDTGIKKTHPELFGKVVDEANFSSDSTPDDLHGHGTHVGSTAAGNSSNSLGIHGVAPGAQLLNAKVLNSSGSGTCDGVANGITWAADKGAHVINLSLGGGGCTTEESAVNYAWGKGAVLACAAGNNGNDGLFYPAAYANCISVGATDRNDQKASFSNFGSTVDVGAPGVAIPAAIPGSSAEVTTSDFGFLVPTGGTASQSERGAIPMEFSEITNTASAALEGQAVHAGLGGSVSDFADCAGGGKIAVIGRGTYTFATKVANAKAAGCVGAVIYNNGPGDLNGTLGSAGDYIPVVGISQVDGQDLVNSISVGLTTVRMAVRKDYGRWNGTSMATPHVSGTAALLWATGATCWGTSNSSVRDRLQSTADQVPALSSYWTLGRRINAASAVSGCGAPPPPDTTPPTVSSINRIGSNPTNAASVSFAVTVSESVTGVGVEDFALATTGVSAAAISSVSGSGSSYTVAVNTGGDDGTIGLNLLDDDSIKDLANNPLGGSGTGNGNFTGQVFTVDKTAPTVTLVTPTKGAGGVAVSTNVTATFSEAMDAASLTTAKFTLVKVGGGATAGVVSYDAVSKTVTLDPTANLDPSGSYTATVTAGAKDLAGNPVVQKQWSFTTAALPPSTSVHVGDLDGTRVNQGSTWMATVTITVHDDNHNPVSGANVNGAWTGTSGASSCTSGGDGRCSLASGNIPKKQSSVAFTVSNVTHSSLTYAGSNHDPETDSNGTSITVNK